MKARYEKAEQEKKNAALIIQANTQQQAGVLQSKV